jgi:hypothetical protein
MADRGFTIRVGKEGPLGPRTPIGTAFAFQASIWRIQGLYLTTSPSGGSELWWLLDEQKLEIGDLDNGGES